MKKANGITLIVLVITIIILLILAGVAISFFINDNGIFNQAIIAEEKYRISDYKEKVELIILDEQLERFGNPKEEPMIKSLQDKFNEQEWASQTYLYDENGVEHQPDIENNQFILIETKDGYEIIVKVNNDTLEAEVVEIHKGINKQYTVTYDPNGASGKQEKEQVRNSFSVLLKECSYTKTGYEFVGWCENRDGSGERYLGGGRYTPKKDTVLYAVWEKAVVTVTFDSNGGTGTMNQQMVAKGQDTNLPNNTYIKTGYTFLEWNSKPDGSGDKYENGAMVNLQQDMILYAMWEENIVVTLTLSKHELDDEAQVTMTATSLATEIQNLELTIGGQRFFYLEDLGTTFTRKTPLAWSIVGLTFYTDYPVVLKATSKTGKEHIVQDTIRNHQIETKNDLQILRKQVNSGNTFSGKRVVQIKSIDLGGSASNLWEPIGIHGSQTSNGFSGVYEGGNFTVQNMYINNSKDTTVGLFAVVKGATIQNLTITGNIIQNVQNRTAGGIVGRSENTNIKNCKNYVNITKTIASAGGIAGVAANKTIIQKCVNEGTINSTAVLGGISGWVMENSQVTECTNNAQIAGTGDEIGGIVARAQNSQITNCLNYGKVTGNNFVAGIVAGANTSEVSSCGNTKDITGNTQVGGIIGTCQISSVSQSYNKGKIQANGTGDCVVGGIVGQLGYNGQSSITDCYNTGNVVGTVGSEVGGIFSNSYSATTYKKTIQNCYNIGNLSGISKVGSITGRAKDATFVNCFWTTSQPLYEFQDNTSSVTNCSYKTAAQLKQIVNTLGTNWKADTSNINNGYPILKWE